MERRTAGAGGRRPGLGLPARGGPARQPSCRGRRAGAGPRGRRPPVRPRARSALPRAPGETGQRPPPLPHPASRIADRCRSSASSFPNSPRLRDPVGGSAPPPAPGVQYADFAARQRAWVGSGEAERGLDAWRRRLAGPPALELFADRARPPVRGFQGARHGLRSARPHRGAQDRGREGGRPALRGLARGFRRVAAPLHERRRPRGGNARRRSRHARPARAARWLRQPARAAPRSRRRSVLPSHARSGT